MRLEWKRTRGLSRLCLVLAVACAACRPQDARLDIEPPRFAGGTAHLEVRLGRDVDASTLELRLDGQDAAGLFLPVAGGVAARVALPGGPHRLDASVLPTQGGAGALLRSLEFQAPPEAPPLLSATPGDGATDVPPSAWLVLAFADEPHEDTRASFGLECDGAAVELGSSALGDGRLVLDPEPALPPAAACTLGWSGAGGVESLSFWTAAAGAAVEVLYDRDQEQFLAPLPDDFFLEPDGGTETGWRVAVPVPDRSITIQGLFTALLEDVNRLDGWSPIAPLVVETGAFVHPDTLPTTPAESLDPLASVQLYDLTPDDPMGGERVPFRLESRDDATSQGIPATTLLLYPSVPLEPGHRYGLVVTRRALAAGPDRDGDGAPDPDPTRPLAPSAFLAGALDDLPGGSAAQTRVEEIVEPIVSFLDQEATPRIAPADIALVLSVRVRSTSSLPDDLLAIRSQVRSMPPPALLSLDAQPEADPASDVAVVVRGTWDAPDWRQRPGGAPQPNVTRGPDGLPRKQTSRPVEFVLALPRAVADGPVPVIFHQHGNPGSQEEVLSNARRFLAGAGFAAIGFTDILNREVAPPGPSDDQRIQEQVLDIFFSLLANQTIPDHWLETTAEQLAFLHFIESLVALDVYPLGAPDGVPDLDLGLPVSYHGISEGGNNGQALIPYAPELKAAALVVGGARLMETLVHQQAAVFLGIVPLFFQGITPADIWTGVSLFQMGYDRQDRHNHLPFAYARPLEVGGTTRKPSVLVIEGLDDSLVPNHATDSTAASLGLPHLAPVARPVPFLPVVEESVRANVDPETTGAYFQYVPVGAAEPPTPGCTELPPERGEEGHFCAQRAKESHLQRALFFQSALEPGPPEIVDPFPFFE